MVDKAIEEIEKDKYVAMIKNSPKQLQATLFSIISSTSRADSPLHTGEAYGTYRAFCGKIKMRALSQRAFSDLVSELDMYGFIQAQLLSQGRYGRTKQIIVNLPKALSDKLKQVVLMEFDLNPVSNQFS
jgi:cell division control protein 6